MLYYKFLFYPGSSKLLKLLFREEPCPGKGRALDCGAGIGRITKHLLTKHFQTVDLGKQRFQD